MAKARTQVPLGITWQFTLEVLNQADTPNWISAPTHHVSASTVELRNENVVNPGGTPTEACYGDAQTSAPGDPPDPFSSWQGMYWPFVLEIPGVGLGGLPIQQQYWLWIGDYWVTSAPVWGPGIVIANDSTGTMSVTCRITYSGIYAKGLASAATLPDRSVMDFTDFSAEYKWYADEGSTYTIDAGPLSQEYNFTTSGEIELGSSFQLPYDFTIHHWHSQNVPYARIGDPMWDSDAVDLSHLDLWYAPGCANPPDPAQPNWSRDESEATSQKLHIYDDGGITTQREGSTPVTGNISWGGWTDAPYLVTFKPLDGKFTDEEDYSIDYKSPAILWYQVDGVWASYPEIFSGDLTADEWHSSWEFNYEWQRLATKNLYVDVDVDWRTANGEDVGDPDDPVAQNDIQCGLLLHPIDKNTFEGLPFWSPFLSVSHLASYDVNHPDGYPLQKPTHWVGYNGAVVGEDDDIWVVPPHVSNPQIARALATRFWLRMDRLGDHLNDPEKNHNADWPIMNRPNLPQATTHDDDEWLASIPIEDSWNWAEYAYAQLDITAPKSGTVTLVVNYSYVTVNDPCYTCFSYRFGYDGEWTYTRVHRHLTYTFNVTPGRQAVLLDLCLPLEKRVPAGVYRLQHVDSLIFTLPDNSTGDNEFWRLNGFKLVEDPGTATRAEPSSHTEYRYKRAWDWYTADWFGLGAVVDGKDALELDYGYHRYRHERKLLYIQRMEHCPGNPATGRLDYAKALSRLAVEWGWQAGWQCFYDTPEESNHNQDVDTNRLKGTFHWWDLRQGHLNSDDQEYEGAVCVGRYSVIAGVRQEIYFYKYPRGKIHGLIRSTSGKARIRNQTQAVAVYEGSGTPPTYSLLEKPDTDAHGRFRSTGLLEKDKYYAVNNDEGWQVANREYTTADGFFRVRGPMISHVRDSGGHIWAAYVNSNHELHVAQSDAWGQDWNISQTIQQGPGISNPNVLLLETNEPMITWEDSANVRWAIRRGEPAWTDVPQHTVGPGERPRADYIPRAGKVVVHVDGFGKYLYVGWASPGCGFSWRLVGPFPVLDRFDSDRSAIIYTPAEADQAKVFQGTDQLVRVGINATTDALELSVSLDGGATWELNTVYGSQAIGDMQFLTASSVSRTGEVIVVLYDGAETVKFVRLAETGPGCRVYTMRSVKQIQVPGMLEDQTPSLKYNPRTDQYEFVYLDSNEEPALLVSRDNGETWVDQAGLPAH